MAKTNFTGELLHFGAVRLRVTGAGNFLTSIKSLDEINTVDLNDIVLAATTAREPTVLANFISQRGFIQIGTTEINETFTVSKIIVYIKEVSTGYPQ